MTALPRENVQDYPRPPAIEPVPQRLRVEVAGRVVAETARGLRILETHHAPTYYFPPDDVQAAFLRPATGTSFCEWKGHAAYFDIVIDETVVPRAAWTYPEPVDRYSALANHLAFYAGRVDSAWVGDAQVRPQPGDFYGGWVTDNLDGMIKGAPGTRHW